MICVAYPTIMDGLVLRWYRNEEAFELHHEMVSASRNGVEINGPLHQVPADVLADANEAYEHLRDGRREMAASMATHGTRIGRRLLMPIVRDNAS